MPKNSLTGAPSQGLYRRPADPKAPDSTKPRKRKTNPRRKKKGAKKTPAKS